MLLPFPQRSSRPRHSNTREHNGECIPDSFILTMGSLCSEGTMAVAYVALFPLLVLDHHLGESQNWGGGKRTKQEDTIISYS